MFSKWVASIILFSAFFGVQSEDAAEKVKQIVANFDEYLVDHLQTHLNLPNIGMLSIDPIKMRNGTVGDFSTLAVFGEPVVEENKNRDGSTTYKFDVKLGLNQLKFKYDYSANFIIYKREGSYTFETRENEMEVSGLVVVQADKSCDATLYTAKFLKYGNYKITLEPNTFPQVTEFTATLLNYVTPMVIPMTNKVLEGTLFVPAFQTYFSDLVCKHMTL